MSYANSGVGSQVISGAMKAVILIVIAVTLFWWFDSREQHSIDKEKEKLSPLGSKLSEFVEIARERQSGSGHIRMKPKVVLLTMDTNENSRFQRRRDYQGVDPLTLKLPTQLRPKEAKEVETIVALYWGQEFLGRYDNGDSAYRQTCRVEVFDRDTGHLIDSQQFSGTSPPNSVQTVNNRSFREKHFGSSCEEEIIEYLTTL